MSERIGGCLAESRLVSWYEVDRYITKSVLFLSYHKHAAPSNHVAFLMTGVLGSLLSLVPNTVRAVPIGPRSAHVMPPVVSQFCFYAGFSAKKPAPRISDRSIAN